MRWIVVAAVLALAPGVAQAADPPDPGVTTSGTVTSNGSEFPFVLYTPASLPATADVPLVVVVHGAQTTAEQQMRSTRFNQVAERERFVVLYPDVDAAGRAQPGPLRNGWKFLDPAGYTRGNGDAAAIAAMTRVAMEQRRIDPERVYLGGMSLGGIMASIEAAAYSDLYAAVAIVASAGYLDGPCFATGTGIPVETSAQSAFAAMGPRGRIVPRMVIGADKDLAFPASCSVKALEQGLRTSNLVLSGSQDAPLSLGPAASRLVPNPGGFGHTVSEFRDPDGCLVAERWIIHGMAHFWPGGTTDPKYKNFTDPRWPNAADGLWSFFSRYRKSDTALPCAEAPRPAAGPSAPAICPTRRAVVTLPRGRRVRSVRATVAGRPARAVRRGRKVTVTLRSGPKARVRVELRVRRAGRSRAQVVRRTIRRC